MAYYPISLAMLVGIKDYIFIINKEDEDIFLKLKKHLESLNLNVRYVIQPYPKGLAEGLILVERYINAGELILYLLGDNILYGHDVPKLLNNAINRVKHSGGAVIFGYPVKDPHRFGIMEVNQNGKVISIEEKPKNPRSNLAIIGIYVFDYRAPDYAKKVKPSSRGELEITSVLEEYLKEDRLYAQILGRGFAWFDAGTHESFLEAGQFVATIENKTGLMIGCIEEIAYRNGWITRDELIGLAKVYGKTDYGKYLEAIAKDRV